MSLFSIFDRKERPMDGRKKEETFIPSTCHSSSSDYTEREVFLPSTFPEENEQKYIEEYYDAHNLHFKDGKELAAELAIMYGAMNGEKYTEECMSTMAEAAQLGDEDMALYHSIALSFDGKQKALHCARMAAENGNAAAMHRLAELIEADEEVQKQGMSAIYWFKKAAEAGSINDMLCCAAYYYEADEIDIISDGWAFEWAQKAMQSANRLNLERRHLPYELLGKMYYYGRGTYEDEDMALDFLEKAEELGSTTCYKLLFDIHFYQSSDKSDLEKAFLYAKKAAENGDEGSLLFEGASDLYDNNDSTESRQKALKWIASSAEYGNAFAMSMLGSIYAEGKLVEPDLDKAIILFEAAATRLEQLITEESDDPIDEDILIRLYKTLSALYNFKNNKQQSLYWNQKAASFGDDEAMLN